MFGPLEPLSEDEVVQVIDLLKQSGSASLSYARGVFSAVAFSPQPIEPTDWLPWLVGPSVPDKATMRHLFGLLMRDANSIGQCLALSEPWFPDTEEELAQFCKGLVRASQHSDTWKAQPDVFLKLLPFAAVAGYVSSESLSKVIGAAEIDPELWLESEKPLLKQRLAEVYALLSEERETRRQASREKIGRNDPCPCGSGKKFKKCCAH